MDVARQRYQRRGRDGRSQMLTGLRGVGKTAMLNEFEQVVLKAFSVRPPEGPELAIVVDAIYGPGDSPVTSPPRSNSTTHSSQAVPVAPATPSAPTFAPWPNSGLAQSAPALADLLGKRTSVLGPTRDGLLKKALCYSPRYGQIDFTVPLFDGFMKRWLPNLPTCT